MTYENLIVQFKTLRPLHLLRAKNAPFILAFFYQAFKSPGVTTITNIELRSKLENFIEDLEYCEKDEELDANSLFDDYCVRATQYIEKWSSLGYLRKYPSDEGEDMHELTYDTIKIFNWLELLQKRDFVGANSRFRDIFFKLKDMIEQSNDDPEARIAELEKKRFEIEEEINQIKLGKSPTVFNDTDIKERFYEINRAARELLGDFTEVEQNFQQIRKDLQRKYAENDLVKGSLLLHALNSLDEIYEKDQGKSFKSFWEFLMDEKKQTELGELTTQLYELLSNRDIDYNNDRFLKNLKRYLHASGRKVIDANAKLSEKISRMLSEKSLLERRRAIELIGSIRQSAYALVETPIKDDAFIEVEDDPMINLIDRYEPGYEKEDAVTPAFPTGQGGELSSDLDLNALFDQFSVDRKILLQRIDTMLLERSQVSLKEIVEEYGAEKGLSEIIGYFSIACSENHVILKDTPDPIYIGNRKINTPLVLYMSSTQNNNAQ